MNLRQQLVFCLNHIRGIEEVCEKITNLQQQLVELLNSEDICNQKKRRHRTIFLWSFVLTAIYAGWVLLMVNLNLQEGYSALDGMGESFVLFIPLIAALIICGNGWSRFSKELRRLRKDNPIHKQKLESDIVRLKKRAQDLIDIAADEDVFRIVPMDYTSSEMLQYCITVVDRKLASTLQEAFLLLEQELQRQEQMAQQQYYYDSQTAQMERLTNAVHANAMMNMIYNRNRPQ